MQLTTAKAELRQSVLRLNYQEKNRQVVFEPENEDRFVLTVEAAIRACQAQEQPARFQSQLRELLQRLAEWVNEHAAVIKDAYLTIRDAGLLFLVVSKKKQYSRQFEDELTDLDVEVATNSSFGRLQLSVLSLPNVSGDSISSFLHPEICLVYKRKNVK